MFHRLTPLIVALCLASAPARAEITYDTIRAAISDGDIAAVERDLAAAQDAFLSGEACPAVYRAPVEELAFTPVEVNLSDTGG